VPVDLGDGSLLDALPAAGYRTDEPGLFLAEGLAVNFGAVLVVRRWGNGQLAYDVVPGRRDPDGGWESAAYGGSSLGESLGAVRGAVEWFADHVTQLHDDEESIVLRMLVGAVAPEVRSVRVRTADGDQYDHPVHHPPGLVVIGAVDAEPVVLTALDSRQRPLATRRWTELTG
jgi:hypothetical protein